jgi:YD repeat-containing protein
LFQRSDLTIPGRGLPFVFTRTYNSLDPYAGPLGHGWTHSFNVLLTESATGSVVIKHGDGREEFYSPLGGGNFIPLTGGIFNILVKNPDGTFNLTLKNQTEYRFSTAGKLGFMRDRNANSLSFIYAGSGNLTTITDTVGRTVTLAYDSNNRITQVTDPIGRKVKYSYDASNNLVSVTDPNGGVSTFSYDASHRITQILNELGNVLVANTYDGSGTVLTQRNGRGFPTTFDYNTPNPGGTAITDPRGNSILHTHDVLFRLKKVTDTNGGAIDFSYDAQNNRTGIVDQNNNTTLFTYGPVKGQVFTFDI